MSLNVIIFIVNFHPLPSTTPPKDSDVGKCGGLRDNPVATALFHCSHFSHDTQKAISTNVPIFRRDTSL
jgi:hypothetical protein